MNLNIVLFAPPLDWYQFSQRHQYFTDTECLKIDLNEEQMRERSHAEQKRKQQKQHKLIEVLSEETTHDNMNDVERYELADKYVTNKIIINSPLVRNWKFSLFFDRHRIKGNESFKCSEYQLAILEYTKSLSYAPTAAVYNNRAVACKCCQELASFHCRFLFYVRFLLSLVRLL